MCEAATAAVNPADRPVRGLEMLIVFAVLVAIAVVGGAVLRARYRHTRREPARSCLAPNRSRGRNVYCQNPTPRGGYCSIHHDQHSRDNGMVISASLFAAIVVAVSIWLQAQQ